MTRPQARWPSPSDDTLTSPGRTRVARVLFAERAAGLEGERRWESTLEKSHDRLAGLADEALAERRAGKTKILDPDAL